MAKRSRDPADDRLLRDVPDVARIALDNAELALFTAEGNVGAGVNLALRDATVQFIQSFVPFKEQETVEKLITFFDDRGFDQEDIIFMLENFSIPVGGS